MTDTYDEASRARPFPLKAFVLTCLVVSLWINASEIFRYFVFVMPLTRETLEILPGVAPMNLPVFLVWGVWDTILTVMAVWYCWLHIERFGTGFWSVAASGTLSWLFLFVLFWIAMMNMGLARAATPAIALPLAWLELVIAALLAVACFRRFGAFERRLR
jgi:hypothetical protein